jgi:hypothetical protein
VAYALVLALAAAAPAHPLTADEANGPAVAVTVAVNPLEVDLAAPARVAAGERFRVEASVRNRSDARLRDLALELRFPDGCLDVNGAEVQRRGALQGDAGYGRRWWAVADGSCHYVVLVAVVRADAGGTTLEAESTAEVVVVAGAGRASR